MTKEEILARAKKENVLGDEREKEVRLKRDAFSMWGLIVLGAIIILIKLIRGQSPMDIMSLLFCTCGLGLIYEGIMLKNKWHMSCGIILLLCAVYYFSKFCAGLL